MSQWLLNDQLVDEYDLLLDEVIIFILKELAGSLLIFVPDRAWRLVIRFILGVTRR